MMYVCSLVVSSIDIGSGGLALHPLVFTAVMVCWSGWMSLACSPFSPCISIGLSPVCTLTSNLIDNGSLAADISILHFSSDGGCMLFSSML